MRLLLLFFFYLSLGNFLIAQEISDSDVKDKTENKESKSSFRTIFSGNPGKAALYSFVLPGAGQVYNKRYWKLPFVYGLEGTALYFLITNRQGFNQFDQCYRGLVTDPSNPLAQCVGATSATVAFAQRNLYRKNAEISLVFLVVAHLLQTIEAFVDRHLIEFDVSEDLSFQQKSPDTFRASGLKLFSIGFSLNKNQKDLTKHRFVHP